MICFNRLRHRAVFQFGQRRRFHGQGPCVIRAGSEIILRQAILHDIPQVATRLGWHALDLDVIGIVLRIGLRDIGVINVGAPHLRRQALNRIVGVSLDGVVDHHLQNQVGSTAEIKPQMNALLDTGQQAFPAEAVGPAEDAEKEHQHHGHNKNRFPGKILFHFTTAKRSLCITGTFTFRVLLSAELCYEVFAASSPVETETTDDRATSSRMLSGGTRK
jgi:hypothetical protein